LSSRASNVGLGAVLIQEYKGQSKVICYASRSLTDVEKKYSTTEKEALSVVWGCEKFHLYLYGINFELVTDHKPLEGLYNAKSKPNARIQRIGKTGNSGKEENIEEYIRFVAKQATPKSLTTREIEEFSRYDVEISEIRVSLDQAKWNRTLTNYYPMSTEFSKLG
jgi:hypothetical protein